MPETNMEKKLKIKPKTMNNIMKYVIAIFAFIVGLFAVSWIFNHVYSWAGILAGAILLYSTIYFIKNEIQKQQTP